MGTCKICGTKSVLISEYLALCRKCIIEHFDKARPLIIAAHRINRREFKLPEVVPKDKMGLQCNQCGNQCSIPLNGLGYCGLKKHTAENPISPSNSLSHGDLSKSHKIMQLAGTPQRARLEWYYDPLPTNCVASWICAEGDRHTYKHLQLPRRKKNLAVFYAACTFNCLFCQNWHFRYEKAHQHYISARELAAAVDTDTSCVCYFGGDPAAQITHAIASALMIHKRTSRERPYKVRICWETNGSMSLPFIKKMLELSLASGGCIKFDLKALDYRVHFALTGVSNKTTLANFRWVARHTAGLSIEAPPLIASTLLVPGYVTVEEVAKIAKFIAGLNPEIPFSLLAFYPQFYFHDLPTTSRQHAEAALEAALAAGLKYVHLGNRHLLTRESY